MTTFFISCILPSVKKITLQVVIPMTKEIIRKEDGNQKLDRIVELSLLFDFYGELLKDHKKQIFEDYILNDLSLSEIAEEQGISRQGVYDLVKRCSKELMEYENKLKLIEKFEHTKMMVNDIKVLSRQIEKELIENPKESLEKVKKIEKISDEILENF